MDIAKQELAGVAFAAMDNHIAQKQEVKNKVTAFLQTPAAQEVKAAMDQEATLTSEIANHRSKGGSAASSASNMLM